MTSVIAWIAADKRRATGLYFASDSRRSWEGRTDVRDDCIKVFAATGTREIFAFAGDATFPPQVLEKICKLFEGKPELVNSLDDPYQRSVLVHNFIKAEFELLNANPKYGFSILHGTRAGAMSGASFHLFEYSYAPGVDFVSYGVLSSQSGEYVELFTSGTGNSQTLNSIGSGQVITNSFLEKGVGELGNVSRVQFSSFCNAVASGQDEWSGGPIQLVGVLSIKDALHFGVITPQGRFYKGRRELPENHSSIRWRNTNFEDVDADGKLKAV